ncbi:MAG: hypothetical protein R3C32_03875 [Chloroflexota bacterium]
MFQSPANDPEGRTFLGSAVIRTGTNGKVDWSLRVSARLAIGTRITATVTDIDRGDTSEFSPSLKVSGS